MFKKTQTVDSIMSSFVQAKTDLLELLKVQAKQLDDIAIKQKELNDEKEAIKIEIGRAGMVLGNLKNILGE